jgi:hypothetical protein
MDLKISPEILSDERFKFYDELIETRFSLKGVVVANRFRLKVETKLNRPKK